MNFHLRPFDEADLVMCDRSVTDPNFVGSFEWIGSVRHRSTASGGPTTACWARAPYNLVVDAADDAPIGWVNWRDTDRAGPGAWEIGVLIAPEMRSGGAGTAAHRLLVDYLFATTPTHRIWAGTEVDNIAEQRALERSGSFRKAYYAATTSAMVSGETASYGITRNDYATAVDDTRAPSTNRKRQRS